MLIATLVSAALALAPTQRAADVTSSLAVNIHIEYTDGDYRDLAQVFACLTYLGIRTVRDAAPNPANQGQAGYAALAKAGIKFDLFVNGGEITPALDRIQMLEEASPGAVSSIEGPNEVNNLRGFRYMNEPDTHSSGAAYQNELFRQVKSRAALSKVPVIAFTDYPYDKVGNSDFGNDHPYPRGDGNVTLELAKVVASNAKLFAGKPLVFTEMGYSTSRGNAGVSELAQSRLLLVSILGNAQAGVKKTYIYELLDAYPDPGSAVHEKHFGLFRGGYLPKQSAQMLRLFMAVYADAGEHEKDFPIRDAKLSWLGGGAGVHKLIVQKSDGEIIVAVWRDKPVYDFANDADVNFPPEPVDLKIGTPHGRIVVSDIVNATRGEARTGTEIVRLALGPNPLIVQISPAGASGTD